MDRISVTRNSKHDTRNQAPRILVLGIGSPFGDDRLGWEAAQALRQAPALCAIPSGRVEIAVLDRPGAMLPTHWQAGDSVILLDAVRSGAAPGTRHSLDAGDLAGAGAPCSTHGFGVVSAIGLARALGNLPARLLLRGMEADPAWTGVALSPVVAAALPAFVADVAQAAVELARSGPRAGPGPAWTGPAPVPAPGCFLPQIARPWHECCTSIASIERSGRGGIKVCTCPARPGARADGLPGQTRHPGPALPSAPGGLCYHAQ